MKVELHLNVTLSESERNRLIASLDDRQFMAVALLLAEDIEEIQQQLQNPEASDHPGTLAHYAGGLASLRYLLARLVDLRKIGGHSSEVED